MKDFPNANFPPETIKLMKDAMVAAVETLPDPVSSGHIQSIAETILRTAKEGERNPATFAANGFTGTSDKAARLIKSVLYLRNENFPARPLVPKYPSKCVVKKVAAWVKSTQATQCKRSRQTRLWVKVHSLRWHSPTAARHDGF